MSAVPPPAAGTGRKSDTAFRTIGEVSTALGVPQHMLRYWETRFPQVKPLQRAGNRRYYRPNDIMLLRRIQYLLDQEGYSIRGVQKMLAEGTMLLEETMPDASVTDPSLTETVQAELIAIRDILRKAFNQDTLTVA